MAGSKSLFDEYLAQEVENSKGVRFPVKTGILSRLLIREARCDDLHPNPEDEFCDPNIGPNYEIIGKYAEKIVRSGSFGGDPLIVQKVNPDGYMLLTMHRWFQETDCPGDWAASRFGQLAEDINAAMDGETVSYDDEFSNGARFPGDQALTPEESCNCQCQVEILIP
jgi:hypothetical protein